MNDERWATIDDLLGAALERDPDDRAAFLHEACAGDQALRQKVDSLLAHASSALDFLNTPPRYDGMADGGTPFVGRQVGSYSIRGLLGEGGMGQVYLAHDSKLGRDVAIKTLPRLFTGDRDRLARFDREARLLASLNHPHIGAIYGLEDVDGTPALVLELVDGLTLAERIATGPLPIDEALTFAHQIADALAAAHDKGIVHRDLKPANIKVTSDGVVKVLDFGLAKASGGDAAGATLRQTGAVDHGATGVGVILGTAAYMSPEQARGQPVDKRTDLWAFGCLLYEMLTGRAPFAHATLADTLAAIAGHEPDWSRLPATLPERVHELLRRCLEKEAKNRRRDIADVRLEIERALSAPAPSLTPVVVGASGPPARLVWMLAAVLAVALTAALAYPFFVAPDRAETPGYSDVVTPAMLNASAFAIAPDGRQLVFVALRNGQPQLYLRSFGEDTAEPLDGTEGALHPFWSPTGESVGFFVDNWLKRMDLDSGLVRPLTQVGGAQGGTWGTGGIVLLAGVPSGELVRVPASGGAVVAVTKLEAGQSSHRFPIFLPDGRRFVFYATGTAAVRGIYLGSLDSPDITRLTEADGSGGFLRTGAGSGWLLYGRHGALLARQLDSARGQLFGDPVTVNESVATANVQGAVSVSDTGVIAYRTGATSTTQLTWFDRFGRPLGKLGDPNRAGQTNVVLSRDGRLRVAAQRTTQNNTGVWITDATREFRFASDAGGDGWPLWSTDGSRIAYVSNKTGASAFYVRASNSTDAETDELLGVGILSDWSRDGRYILYFARNKETLMNDLWALPLEGERQPLLVARSKGNSLWGQFSPNGQWVAYQSNESGRHEVYVRPFPGPGVREPVSISGGIHPRWAPDGTEIYFVAPDGTLMAAPITATGSAPAVGTPRELFKSAIVGGGAFAPGFRQQYDVAPDGRFLINVETEGPPTGITLLLDWKGR